jgi:hypothetical protein
MTSPHMSIENKTLKPRRLIETLKAWLHQWWLLIIPVTLACMAVGAYIFAFHAWPTHEVPAAWGTFGDFVGGLLNPVVSTLTLFVAIQVWHLQRKELEETKTVLAEQAKTAEQQRSEQRFFDVLNLYFRTVEVLGYREHHGRRALEQWSTNQLKGNTHDSPRDHSLPWFFTNGFSPVSSSGNTPQQVSIPELKTAWNKPIIDEFLSPYLRVVFRLLTDAEALFKDPEDRRRYMKLFRAQLSSDELTLIGLNLWLSDIGQKMRPVANTYGLLKHLPKGHLRTALEQEMPEVFGKTFESL